MSAVAQHAVTQRGILMLRQLFGGTKIMDFELKEGNKGKYSILAIRDFIERLPLWPGRGASG